MESLNKTGTVRKAQAGIFPGCAPLGYRNVRLTWEESWIEPDPVTAPLVRETSALAAGGKQSGRQILDIVAAKGLRSRNGGPKSHGNFMQLLRNPFYAGSFRFDGKEYAGTHDLLVSRELFAAAQPRPDGRRSRRDKSHHSHRGDIFQVGR